MAKSVPDRWLEYKAYGDVIEGTKILPLKVPLKETISKYITPKDRFTPAKLLKELPRLKYLIDLTNTNRYYDSQEFTNAGVKYKKIMVPGHIVPPKYCVTQFIETMDEFMATAEHYDVIGVHCTHGINRSGYMICRYLIQHQHWDVEKALQAFNKARGYPIERSNYVVSLKDQTRIKETDNPAPNVRAVMMSGSSVHQGVMQTPFPRGPPRRGFVPPGFVPPGFAPPRHGFVNRTPYAPQPFGFGAPPPGFGSMPPHSSTNSYRFGPPPPPLPPPAMRVSGPGFHPPGFPLRLPGPLRMPRLPPGPSVRLPPPTMPPPPPPSRTQIRQPVTVKRIHGQKKKQHQQHMRNGVATLPRSPLRLTRREVGQNTTLGRSMLKIIKEQDFTIDTFEENLLAVATTNAQLRRPHKGRYNQAK